MKYEVAKCDICGKNNLKEGMDFIHLSIPYDRTYNTIEYEADYKNYDICINCLDNFLTYKLFKKNSFIENKRLIDILDSMKRIMKTG